jgi:hypothetical protein
MQKSFRLVLNKTYHVVSRQKIIEKLHIFAFCFDNLNLTMNKYVPVSVSWIVIYKVIKALFFFHSLPTFLKIYIEALSDILEVTSIK